MQVVECMCFVVKQREMGKQELQVQRAVETHFRPSHESL